MTFSFPRLIPPNFLESFERLGSDATFNFIGGGTEATYGASNDWNLSVGGTDCDMASEIDPCQVTISQGDTSAEVTVEVHANSPAEVAEDFTVSVAVDSGSVALVTLGSSSSLNFIIEGAPTVSLSFSGGRTLLEDSNARHMPMLQLSEALTRDVVINLVQSSGSATYGTSSSNSDYTIIREVQGSNSNCQEITGSMCQVTIPAGQTSFDFLLQVYYDFLFNEETEDMTLSISVNSASENLVALGSDTSLRFEITNVGM